MTLDFKNILTQVFFYQKANLGQLTAKSEKDEFFCSTLISTPIFFCYCLPVFMVLHPAGILKQNKFFKIEVFTKTDITYPPQFFSAIVCLYSCFCIFWNFKIIINIKWT